MTCSVKSARRKEQDAILLWTGHAAGADQHHAAILARHLAGAARAGAAAGPLPARAACGCAVCGRGVSTCVLLLAADVQTQILKSYSKRPKPPLDASRFFRWRAMF